MDIRALVYRTMRHESYVARNFVPALYMVRMGHWIGCPRFAWYVWGTDIRARVLLISYGARNSVPALYIMHRRHGNSVTTFCTVSMWNGYPCPHITNLIWGTECRACLIHYAYRARNSVPAFCTVHTGHGNSCPPYTLCIYGTEFRAGVLHGANGARISMPHTYHANGGHQTPCLIHN